ncbi:hypothetical protein CJ030_MR1G005684 [Morella rubra]|uniref:Phytocyanin domain-containing protein n=1 Tax=Morella rubra TaxID=262757 RepID=A0A6A1WKX4_9ROSI|nr:hypothetical protein CJ030_MR1G005684 [Morella rubra]
MLQCLATTRLLCLNISEHLTGDKERQSIKSDIMSTATALLILLLAAPFVYGSAQHIVGGNAGWSTIVNYPVWAADQNFTVGDTLVCTSNLIKNSVRKKIERTNQ